MGGTQMEVYQPSPPPQPSTADAINAWVQSMPQVFATQQQFAPLQAQQQLELLQQYGPQFGAATKAANEALYPETAALQENLAGQATEGMEQGLADWEKEQYRSDLAANLGTNAGSPIGADYMSRGLLAQQQQRQDYYRNLGLSLAGRQQLAQPGAPTTGAYSQGFTPQNTMNMAAQTYAPFAAASRPEVQWSPGGVQLGILGRWGGSF